MYMGALLGIKLRSQLQPDAELPLVAVLSIQIKIEDCQLEKRLYCRDFLRIFILKDHSMISLSRLEMRFLPFFQFAWLDMCLQCLLDLTVQTTKDTIDRPYFGSYSGRIAHIKQKGSDDVND